MDANPFVVIKGESPPVEPSAEKALNTTMEHVVGPPPHVEHARGYGRGVKPPTWLHDFVHKPVKQPTSCQYLM
ncbi:hypothetical protein H5410_062317 [Solanum commersonii]|uniref:Uncharacterized protein n=1 Tax=Solanum commersonii TaxID=4109 RepID=A0A9J5WB69_SOLCO|nr:hypothetical protein H5410_062317 [Solanum commersonii]